MRKERHASIIFNNSDSHQSPVTSMKLTLPLPLLAALVTSISYAQTIDYKDIDTLVIPDTPVIGSAEENYMVKVTGSNGSCYDVAAKDVTWKSSYNFTEGVMSVGSVLTESTLTVVTEADAEEETIVTTNANLFIGGWGWGISATDKLDPKNGTVKVQNATLIVGLNSGGDSSVSQLNVGQTGNYADTGCVGTLEVDAGTVRAGVIDVAMSRGTKGVMTVSNGSTVTVERRGDPNNAKNYTGSLYLGYYANSIAEVTVEGKSTLTVDKDSWIGMAYDEVSGGSTATLTVKGESTANLGSMLLVGYDTGAKGTVTVDNSTLTAGTTYLGYYGEGTSGTLILQNKATATLGDTYLGGSDGAKGFVTVDASTLKAGDTYVGDALINGSLDVKNGGSAELSYLYVGDTVSVDANSSIKVTENVDVIETGKLHVTKNSTVPVGGNMTVAAGGTVDVDSTSQLTVVGQYINEGDTGMNVNANSQMSSGSVSNSDSLTISLKENSSFSVNEYLNAGDTAVESVSGTSCYFGSMQLSSGNMVLKGEANFVLGQTVDGTVATTNTVFTVSGQTAEAATSTSIDITAVNVAPETTAGFTIADGAAFKLNFTDEALAGIAASSAEMFKLTLIYGYEGFSLEDDTLMSLLANTTYNIDKLAAEAAVMTLALEEEAPAVTYGDFVVTSAQYAMEGNNLVWMGVVQNNAVAVPEPATTTLSLLALAGLAARRRRK